MRVCHVSPHLPPDQAANALLPAALGAWSAERGHEVAFVTQPAAQGVRTASELSGPVYRVRPRSSSSMSRWLRFDALRRSRSIAAALDRAAAQADLLHLHSNGLIIEVAAYWARRRRIPYVLTLYGTEIWHYRRRRFFDPFTDGYHSASAVTFYSQRLLDRARELGLNRNGLRVIYPAVSDAFRAVDSHTRRVWKRELGIHETRVVLNVKRLHELAGQRFLIEAFARLRRRHHDVRLVICGTGPLRPTLERLARDQGVAEFVTFTGLLPNARIAQYAAVADVFALPSLLEALPTVAVEALAAGTPVVSADHPGGQELHGLFGRDVDLVPRQDVDRLSAALEDALASPHRVSEATREGVDERFSPSAVHAAYEAVYGEVTRRAIL
jgi:glycosyltransferase involved in cell wall biosynthesis